MKDPASNLDPCEKERKERDQTSDELHNALQSISLPIATAENPNISTKISTQEADQREIIRQGIPELERKCKEKEKALNDCLKRNQK